MGIQQHDLYNLITFMTTQDIKKGEIYILTQSVLWGMFPIVTVLINGHIGSLFSAALSMLVSSLFFAALLTYHQSWKELLVRSAFIDALKASLFIGVMYYGLVFTSLNYTTAGNVAIIGQMEVFTSFFILSIFLRQEPYTRTQILGSILMVIGAITVLLPNASAVSIGDGIMLLACFFPPIGNLAMKRARKRVNTEPILFLRSIIGGLFLLCFAYVFDAPPEIASIIKVLPYILLNGFIFLGVRLWLWLEGVHRIAIPKAIALSSISPLLTLSLAFFVLNETIKITQVLGSLPIIAGVYFLTRTEDKNSTLIVHPVV